LLEQCPLASRQTFGCVAAFVFEQVTQILAGEPAKHPTATPENRSQLKVDDAGCISRHAYPVCFLCEVVVRDAASVHLLQQTQCIFEIERRIEGVQVHGCPGQVIANELGIVAGPDGGYATDAGRSGEREPLTAHEPAREPAQSSDRRAGVPNDPRIRAIRHERDCAEWVAFQNIASIHVVFVRQFHALASFCP
jgi:hypothetical protein